MEIDFSKIHGLGNDFVVVNELQEVVVQNKVEFAKKFCTRNKSIGADGVLFLCESGSADFKMRIFNADGSEAENCVNGLRCVALQKYLLGGRSQGRYSIETLAGKVNAKIISLENNIALVEIEFLGKKDYKEKDTINIDGRDFDYHFIDVGNPHAVFFLDEPVKDFQVEEIGHKIEHHEKFFPSRTNAEFVNVISKEKVEMRVHERGACETMACGSGSIAIVIAGVKSGLIEKGAWIKVQQPGGTIEITFDGKNILLKAQAEKVFDGTLVWG
tara:strand:+ start:213 stop:1028 length:816 start_codon:yes stop_codon:yes gene_type:complete